MRLEWQRRGGGVVVEHMLMDVKKISEEELWKQNASFLLPFNILSDILVGY